MEIYSYELTPQPTALGGGWLLRLLRNGKELGWRKFPAVSGIKDEQLATTTAYDDALAQVTIWLASIKARPPSMRPRPNEGGMYLLMPDDELLCPELPTGVTQPINVECPQRDAS